MLPLTTPNPKPLQQNAPQRGDYYRQLEAMFLPYIQQYQTDLTRHDKQTLTGYVGPFVFGCSTHGTDLIRLNETLLTKVGRAELRSLTSDGAWQLFLTSVGTALTMPGHNHRFAVGESGVIREVTRQEAIDFAQRTFTQLVKPYCLKPLTPTA